MNKQTLWRFLSVGLLLILISGSLGTYAQEGRKTEALSIQEAVAYAKQHSYQVKKVLEDIRIQQQVNREVTASALPQVNGSFNLIDNIKLPVSLVPGEFFGGAPGTFIPVQFGVQYSATTGAELNQILFDGQVFVGLQARNAAMEFARKNAEITEVSIAVNVHKVYYQLLIGEQQLELFHDNIERFEKLYHDTREIYKNGFAEQLDVDKVNVTLTNLRTDSLKLKTQINNGYLGLKMLLGMPLTDSLVLTDKLSDDLIKENLLDSAYSVNDRREFQLLQIGKELNDYNVKRYKLMALPTVSVFGNYFTNAQRNEFDFFKSGGRWFQQSTLGLRINVPIFDGNRRRALLEQARSAVRKTEYDMELLKLSIENDVASARNRYRASVLAVDAQMENVELAERVYDQTKKKYEQGLGSNTEINAAQTELRTAQTNLFTALYEAALAKVDYLTAIGKIY
ncbi:TolC family protein [Flavihumibacter cheonanensis]|uniref:TolC family protein n=1 Tax=Flavihumibacter cheonanensis TaxID=1442385 RepID=UPI001EF86573|nr:TolC family protein [Flavihumibacter cheonanensis]MCG7753368.1 TolC family protein [Flavihumibacter cheonanensis]